MKRIIIKIVSIIMWVAFISYVVLAADIYDGMSRNMYSSPVYGATADELTLIFAIGVAISALFLGIVTFAKGWFKTPKAS